jgi:transcriptional regulator with XRE-family HTH domain
MAKSKRALSVNQVFAYRLRDARLTRRWTQQDLADAMKRVGYPINRVTIAKIEAGARGVGGAHGDQPSKSGQTRPRDVSLEEAIAFAVALDVPPPSLFLPIIRQDDVQLTSRVRIDVDTAHAWTRGERPLDPENARYYSFQTYARPATLADLEALGIRVIHEPKED